nr:DUF1707 and DUF2154 domain-containing protein [Acidimicrobiia bacterium]
MNDDEQSESGHLRVSDHERQTVVDRLSAACGDGMLTLDEFADHAAAAYAAITRADLDAATADLRLPVLAPRPAPPAALPVPVPLPTPGVGEAEVRPKRKWMIAIMGGEDRRGRWRANRRMGAFALMGGVDIDLRDALLEGSEIEITAWAIMGGVNVVVPEGIYVETSGFVLMGGRSNRVKDVEPVPGAPVIRVKGYGLWGGVDVRSKPSTAEEAAQREARKAERRIRSAGRHGPPAAA